MRDDRIDTVILCIDMTDLVTLKFRAWASPLLLTSAQSPSE